MKVKNDFKVYVENKEVLGQIKNEAVLYMNEKDLLELSWITKKNLDQYIYRNRNSANRIKTKILKGEKIIEIKILGYLFACKKK